MFVDGGKKSSAVGINYLDYRLLAQVLEETEGKKLKL